MKLRKGSQVFDSVFLSNVFYHSLLKLNPVTLLKNPIMFIVLITAVAATAILVHQVLNSAAKDEILVSVQIVVWLWFTVLFANFAESLAEGRGKARANSFRKSKAQTMAKKLAAADRNSKFELIQASALYRGDIILVEAGDIIPGDGEVIQGIATVNEAVVTGESAPVIRESGGDHSAVTGGTQVVSDWIIVQITANPGETFLDHMIDLVESSVRQKTPNEIALNITLIALTLVFVVVTVTLAVFITYFSIKIPLLYLIALLVTLIPTTIGGLLSAIGIAGMDRLLQYNIIALSGRAVEAAGDVDTLLLDKTGTITFGNRMASGFCPLAGVQEKFLAEIAMLASLSDDTPEGKSIVKLAGEKFNLKEMIAGDKKASYIPFSAKTRISGVNLGETIIRKGAVEAIMLLVDKAERDRVNKDVQRIVEQISRAGGTPLLVLRDKSILGLVHLKDIIKPGLRERFIGLRQMGIKTVMITGDNPLTAATIAAEAGVDSFVAEATPDKKLEFIKQEQAQGKLVAMCGDGANDAPALAQSDVGIAMNIGTQAAREAGNMIDLDSNPTKLIEVVMTGKQLLMSRGALTTFSIANDVAKYFAIIPAIFVTDYPVIAFLNVMKLHTPESAIVSAIIFNALIIVFLIPLALKGVKYKPAPAKAILARNLLIYGLGGIITPFIGIKVIDVIINRLGWV